ncbi:metallophosphoesterase [Coraliomargarita sp. W4R53]
MKALFRPLFIIFIVFSNVVSSQTSEPFFFIQLTDPQFGFFNKNIDFDQETANLELAVATVNRLRPAFVVVTGDLVNRPGDAVQIAEYQRIIGKVDTDIPVYNVVGNHDIKGVPTEGTVEAYEEIFGPDRYTFEYQGLIGIVLNSVLIHSPQKMVDQFEEQERWLVEQLRIAKEKNPAHIVVFSHHPWFLENVDEEDQYFNIPIERRARYLDLFRQFGVKYLFCGHYHRNTVARDQGFECVTTGPVGRPIAKDHSGLCLAVVYDDTIEHDYHSLGKLPNQPPVMKEK